MRRIGLAGLRDAHWLDRSRIEGYAAIFLAIAIVASVVWISLAKGLIDPVGSPLGPDFSNVYAAGRLADSGVPELAFFPETHWAEQKLVFGRDDVPFYGWPYPPMFLFAAAALALMPYAVALAVWMAVTLAFYLRTMAPLVRGFGRTGWLLALSYPAVFINIANGQNGFLTTGLFGSGLLAMPSRPALAGVFFGLLTYKPQFGILIPLVLIATGRWRVFWWATATALAVAGASWLAFGPESWSAFVTQMSFTRHVVLEAGDTGWHKIQSLFAALRHWGAPVWLAYTGQAILGLGIATLLVRIWRGDIPYGIKAGALAVGAVLATPYLLDYDLVVLALPAALLVHEGLRTGFAPWEKAVLVAVFLMPLVTRTVGAMTTIPLGVIVPALLLYLFVRRAGLLRGFEMPGHLGVAHEMSR